MEVKGLGSPKVEDAAPERTLESHFFVNALSPAIRALERIIEEIAPTDIPVLLVGESGTGKEVVALRVHQLSGRRREPFLKLVCTTLAPDLLEEPLHGNGEVGRAQELLSAGTLFLDEISELDAACQPKLLHVLPDGDALPHPGRVRARVISASRRDLEEAVRSGHFREELYYRINGVCLHLPPLRHRREDIPGLTDFFLTKYAAHFGRPQPSLSPETLCQLVDYSWPGNIRQLENVVKKIVALGDEEWAMADFRSPAPERPAGGGVRESLSLKQAARAASREAERELILKTLERTRWNRKRAARALQISYKALLYKLKQIGLEESAEPLGPGGERR